MVMMFFKYFFYHSILLIFCCKIKARNKLENVFYKFVYKKLPNVPIDTVKCIYN